MTDLIPPDFDRCQCEITPAHGAFRLGPRPNSQRCVNPPEFLAVEVVPGADGRRGSMCLCLGCAQRMLENEDLRGRVQLQPVLKKKAGVSRK